MDEFGAELDRNTGARFAKRIDPPSESASRFENGDLRTAPNQLACGRKTGSASPDDNNVVKLAHIARLQVPLVKSGGMHVAQRASTTRHWSLITLATAGLNLQRHRKPDRLRNSHRSRRAERKSRQVLLVDLDGRAVFARQTLSILPWSRRH
jgi:hypothetical protein